MVCEQFLPLFYLPIKRGYSGTVIRIPKLIRLTVFHTMHNLSSSASWPTPPVPHHIAYTVAFVCSSVWIVWLNLRFQIICSEAQSGFGHALVDIHLTITKKLCMSSKERTHCQSRLYYFIEEPSKGSSAWWLKWGEMPNREKHLNVYMYCYCQLFQPIFIVEYYWY